MPYRQNRYNVWRCRCAHCGGDVFVNTRRLQQGAVCGCAPQAARGGSEAEDLAGQVFGDLKVLRRAESHPRGARWMCECACKNSVAATAYALKSGRIKSCASCRKNGSRRSLDLKGRRFGRLTALSPTARRDHKGSVIWHCRCDCQNELDLSADALVHGGYRSCGCLKKEVQQNIPRTLHLVDNTCVEHLEKRKHRSDNTSGFRGVYPVAQERYRAMIGFKRQRFHLGVFDTFDEAVQARLEAENMLHNGFVEAYRRWSERAAADPGWADKNPFTYDAQKVGDRFVVRTTAPENAEAAEVRWGNFLPRAAAIWRYGRKSVGKGHSAPG